VEVKEGEIINESGSGEADCGNRMATCGQCSFIDTNNINDTKIPATSTSSSSTLPRLDIVTDVMSRCSSRICGSSSRHRCNNCDKRFCSQHLRPCHRCHSSYCLNGCSSRHGCFVSPNNGTRTTTESSTSATAETSPWTGWEI
jgi:hypothetical protein